MDEQGWHGTHGCGVACCTVGYGSWVLGCGRESVVDGGMEGGAIISWWSAWGERAVIGFQGLEVEATLGEQGGQWKMEYGIWLWDQGEKG